MSRRIVAADVGGTHARFALVTIDGARVAAMDEPVTLKTADHGSFQLAWEEFGRRSDEPLPPALAISFAGPVGGELLKLTNNPWVIRPALISEKLGATDYVVVNDFGAVGHAVAAFDGSAYTHLCGPDEPLPSNGLVTILGPGTGLGVAGLFLQDGRYQVIETEGGHVDFAPLDGLEDRILTELRKSFRRVSVERLLSGRGLMNLYEAIATIEGQPATIHDEKALWTAAMEGSDSLAAAALDRFCLSLGAVAGDLALAQGASAVAIGGGLGYRLREHLPRSGFRDRFIAKGRFERRMDAMPVKLITHPQPGLFGAAAAFAKAYS